MRPKTSRPLRYLVSAVGFFGAVIGWSSPSNAAIQNIVIDKTATVNFSPIPLGSSIPGNPTSYTVYQGRIFGTLDPTQYCKISAISSGVNGGPCRMRLRISSLR